jgi:preprotein translocase SecE subunit
VARTDRQQRRQRRAEKAGIPPLRPPARPVAAGGDEPPPKKAAAETSVERAPEGRRGIPGVRFFQEAIGEMRKVEWPSQQQVVSGTAVVIVACVIVGVYLYANDRLWSYVVEHVLLR